jgi:hypothetical protein
MDKYRIVLFVHILTLMVAAGATAVIKVALSRRARARTVREMLDWHTVLMKSSIIFPICLAAFVLTGGYMLSISHMQIWSNGFIVAGLAAVAALLISGTILGTKGKALMKMLEALAEKGPDQPAPKLSGPAYLALLPFFNTGLVVGVAYDMVTKPTSIPTALTILAVGAGLGALLGKRVTAPAPAPLPAAEG